MPKIIILISALLLIGGCSTTENIPYAQEENVLIVETKSGSVNFELGAALNDDDLLAREKMLREKLQGCFKDEKPAEEQAACYEEYSASYIAVTERINTVILEALSAGDMDKCLTVAEAEVCQDQFKSLEQRKERDRQELIFNKALVDRDLDLCLSLDLFKSICKSQFAIRYNDKEMCLELPDDPDGDVRYSARYNCLYKIAEKTLDTEVCNLADKNTKDKWGMGKENCLKGILIKEQKKLTVGLTDEDISKRAVTENNFNICLSIDSVENQVGCQLGVAKINHMGYCERIGKFNASRQIFDCYKFYGYELVESYLFDSKDTDKDGLYDYIELQVWKTDPKNIDTDGDGYNDGSEIESGYDPLRAGALLD